MNGNLTVSKKKTFFSIIKNQSVGISLTQMKTLLQKEMMLGLEKGKKNKTPNRGNHS